MLGFVHLGGIVSIGIGAALGGLAVVIVDDKSHWFVRQGCYLIKSSTRKRSLTSASRRSLGLQQLQLFLPDSGAQVASAPVIPAGLRGFETRGFLGNARFQRSDLAVQLLWSHRLIVSVIICAFSR
jgi:hypothetical protein